MDSDYLLGQAQLRWSSVRRLLITSHAVNIWVVLGVLRNLVMSNISGSSWAISAGVWVEDSQPLLVNVSVDRADHGVVVRHIDDSGYTRAVFRDCTVSNSMYRGRLC